MRLNMILLAAALFGVATPASTSAQTIQCDQNYSVQSGDTLQKIAERAYGRRFSYELLYQANRAAIGRNPYLIQIGLELWVPCPAPTSEKRQDLNPVREMPGGLPQMKLVTGSDFQPFTHEPSPNGGMFTEIVERSLQIADADLRYKIDFIDDWDSHLRPLLADGVYDMGFPWYKPNCSQYDLLGEDAKWRCDNLNFSEIFYETVVSYFGRRDTPLYITAPENVHGKTLCRPEGYFTHDLEVHGMVEPNVTLVQPKTVKECFDKLISGDVDIVTINVLTADRATKRLGIEAQIREYDMLATIETLHVVTKKTHPRSRPLLLRLKRGLTQLRQSGDYKKVVEKHLSGFTN